MVASPAAKSQVIVEALVDGPSPLEMKSGVRTGSAYPPITAADVAFGSGE